MPVEVWPKERLRELRTYSGKSKTRGGEERVVHSLGQWREKCTTQGAGDQYVLLPASGWHRE